MAGDRNGRFAGGSLNTPLALRPLTKTVEERIFPLHPYRIRP